MDRQAGQDQGAAGDDGGNAQGGLAAAGLQPVDEDDGQARDADAGLTQAEVAEKMGTTQSVVARIESGRNPPTLKTLEKYARAVGRRVTVKLVPAA